LKKRKGLNIVGIDLHKLKGFVVKNFLLNRLLLIRVSSLSMGVIGTLVATNWGKIENEYSLLTSIALIIGLGYRIIRNRVNRVLLASILVILSGVVNGIIPLVLLYTAGERAMLMSVIIVGAVYGVSFQVYSTQCKKWVTQTASKPALYHQIVDDNAIPISALYKLLGAVISAFIVTMFDTTLYTIAWLAFLAFSLEALVLIRENRIICTINNDLGR